ncbi:ABC transporter permease [Microbacterium sp. YY-01]|uniref:ABC transporter permease n=1 Tax=Microbacterium sp. YY-01 TaxID=3421634 RepID=UPI003D169C86
MSETVSVRARTGPSRRLPRGFLARIAPSGITFIAMAIILIVCMSIQPAMMSTVGLTLVFASIVPIVFAALAQMVVMSVGDIDLGIGAYIGLVTGVSATILRDSPLLGFVTLVGLVLAYAAVGALVQLRKVPSLIATLGASFVWFGVGLSFLPTPGGRSPDWLFSYAAWMPPLVPAPLLVITIATVAMWLIMQRTPSGARIRALGSNPVVLTRSGQSPLQARMLAYAIAGILGILGGLALSAEIGGGDVASSDGYTLVSVAAVILGGGTFFGGRATAWGAAFGAITLGLLTVLLTFLSLPSSVQPAIQGAIVFVALAGRLIVEKVMK